MNCSQLYMNLKSKFYEHFKLPKSCIIWKKDVLDKLFEIT